MRRRFTIIELMTVIVIIAVLVSLIMPAISRARERAFGASCMANINSLSFSYFLYTKDNNFNLVGADTGKSANDWVKSGDSEKSIRDGVLYSYVNSVGAYRCPKDFRWDKFETVRSDYFWRAFSINGFLNGERKRDREGSTRLTQVDESYEDVFLFVEEQDPRGYNMNSFFLKRPPHTLTTWVNADWMAPLHLQGYNLSFLDGHVEYIKTLDPLSLYASFHSGIHIPDSNFDRRELWSYHFTR